MLPTPHIATGVPPGDFLSRDGYRADYPFRKPTDKEQVANTRDCDQAYKEAIQDKANKSVKRHKDNIEVRDKVLPKNNTLSKKSEPKFHPTPLQFTEVGGYGLFLENPTNRKRFQHHKNDVKLFVHQEESRVNLQDFPPDTRELEPTMQPGPSAGEPLATPQGKEDTQNQTNETTLSFQGLRPVRNCQPPAWMKDYITK